MEGSGMTSFLEELTRSDELPGQECSMQSSMNRMDMQMQQSYWPMQSANQMHYGNQYSMMQQMQSKTPGYGIYNTTYNYPTQAQPSPLNITPPRGTSHPVGQQSPMWTHHSPGSEKSQNYGLTSPQGTPQRVAGASLGNYGAGYGSHLQSDMMHHRMGTNFSDSQKYMHSQMPRSHMQMMVGSGAATRLTGPVQYLYSQGPMNISVHVNSDTGHATGHAGVAGSIPPQQHSHSMMGQVGQQVNVAVQQMNVVGQQHQQLQQQNVNAASQQMYNMPMGGHGSNLQHNMHHMGSHHSMMGQQVSGHSQHMQMHHGMQSAMHNYQSTSNMQAQANMQSAMHSNLQYNSQNASQAMASNTMPNLQQGIHASQNISAQAATSNAAMIHNQQYHSIGTMNQAAAASHKINQMAAQQNVNQPGQHSIHMSQQSSFQQQSNSNQPNVQQQSIQASLNAQQTLQQTHNSTINMPSQISQQLPTTQQITPTQLPLQQPASNQISSQQLNQLTSTPVQQSLQLTPTHQSAQLFDRPSTPQPTLNNSQQQVQPKILSPQQNLNLTPTNQLDICQQPNTSMLSMTLNSSVITASNQSNVLPSLPIQPLSSSIISNQPQLTPNNLQPMIPQSQQQQPQQQLTQPNQLGTQQQSATLQPVNQQQTMFMSNNHSSINQQGTHSAMHYPTGGQMQAQIMHGNATYQYSASSNQYAGYRMGSSYPSMQQQQLQASPSSIRNPSMIRPGPEGGYIRLSQDGYQGGYQTGGYWQRSGTMGYHSDAYLESEIHQLKQQIHALYQQPQSPSNQQQIQDLQDKLNVLQHQHHAMFQQQQQQQQQHRQGQLSGMQPLRIQTNNQIQMSGSKNDSGDLNIGPPQISPYPMSHHSNSSLHQLERDCPPTLHTPDSRSYSNHGSNMHTPNSTQHMSATAESHYKISPHMMDSEQHNFLQHFSSSGREEMGENMASLLQDNEPLVQKKKRKRKAIVEEGEESKVKKRRTRKVKEVEMEVVIPEQHIHQLLNNEEEEGMVLINAVLAVTAVISEEHLQILANQQEQLLQQQQLQQQIEHKPKKLKAPKQNKIHEGEDGETKSAKKRGRKKVAGDIEVAGAGGGDATELTRDGNMNVDENTNSLEAESSTTPSAIKLKVKIAARPKSKKDRPLPTFLKSKKKKKVPTATLR